MISGSGNFLIEYREVQASDKLAAVPRNFEKELDKLLKDKAFL
jgi:hypothetical protein